MATRLLSLRYLPLHEGKTFRQYNDRWAGPPRYTVSLNDLGDKPGVLNGTRHFRLAHREIAGPGDENVSIWAILPPGVTCGNKAPTERVPEKRKTACVLWLLGIANSSVYDWLLSQRVRATVNGFIRDSLPVPFTGQLEPLIVKSALRLSCNHAGYAPLWLEQLGNAWREPKPAFAWPVLATDDERWEVRAAIDAVVADAYGLDRDQYAHVLSTFSHRSYPKAPALCLAKFDELKRTGLDAFTRKYDPYWDIPLNENLPSPVIELPGISEGNDAFTLDCSSGKRPKRGAKRR